MIGINIDLGDLAGLIDMEGPAKKAVDEAARDLAAMIHAKVTELAQQKLHSRRQMFIENLSYSQVSDDVWLISLNAKARWIDDGQIEHNMLDRMLASPKAKRAKDGSKYLVVPFEHGPGKGKASTTEAQQDLISTVKAEMKKRGIPFGTIEKHGDGSPKIGKLHSFDISKSPLKTEEGPGQGKGKIGDVKQGPTGIPFLQGVSVYQKQAKGKDGVDRIKKSIMTFRIASSKHKGGGRWDHPGNDAMNIMEDALKWAMDTWKTQIEPALVSKITAEIVK